MTDAELAPAEEVQDLLEAVVEALDLDAKVSVTTDDAGILGTVDGPNAELLIGAQGELLEAIQHIAQRTVKRTGTGPRVLIDAGGYRARRAEALIAGAEEAAETALRTGEPVALAPMPSTERRIIHEHLRDRADVDTHSEGDEPQRHLVVAPAHQ